MFSGLNGTNKSLYTGAISLSPLILLKKHLEVVKEVGLPVDWDTCSLCVVPKFDIWSSL